MHILLATDFCKGSENLAKKAAEFAKQFKAKLTLIHTIEPIPAYGYPGITELESPLIEHAKAELEKLANHLNLKNVEHRIEFGSVKTQVLSVADELGIDLIIVGSHGRHGLSRLLGSSASAIVHGAHCDVFVFRMDT